MAHEVIQTTCKSKERRMMLKLDMHKAYDRVDRGFLLEVLRRISFGVSWMKWIKSMILDIRTSVLIMETPKVSLV